MNCKTALTQGLPHWCSGKFISAVSVADVWAVPLPHPVVFWVVHKNLSEFFIRLHERDHGPYGCGFLSCMIRSI